MKILTVKKVDSSQIQSATQYDASKSRVQVAGPDNMEWYELQVISGLLMAVEIEETK